MPTQLTTRPPRHSRSVHAVAQGLGWFSIGLGLAEFLAPRAMAKATGMQGREEIVKAYGLREIATGIGILAARDPSPWLWARVGGDALDMATLGARVQDLHLRRDKNRLAMAAVAGVAAVDLACAQALTREERRNRAVVYDYSDRSGLPLPPDEMRGAALEDFKMPEDMRPPAAMRPYVVSDALAGR